ncbi:nitrogenase iron-molybdenum cofactor biosynthesis protein NifE [Rhodospirillum rubrum]|uniref:nitrogenase iron-molybdenum cofactor biosynthesis protein NifE n=1 Tax=Rhodospirillum rubrum TaxID=1085 RepID=UPI001904BDF3|nr:nitrogenase iron-molybdenum cofactor biosynthesis protein NifE [Rhodospirillum rubrum]MBK1666063.1 nitrogenase iron-molybdenum cofactor biosynthesis protein NifE [Rhodospirillum rubrum]MBK1677148.1 nitrogenase iron-molybdenum cofactor biosynthesis protein NifE [Rhodospirillum rubrum]
MISEKIASVFNEPDCEKNRGKTAGERKKGCGTKGLTPGAAAGGCAFDGAKIALQPVTDVVHLVHGPIACEGNSWDTRNVGTSGPLIYRWGFTTDLSEMDVIHGGEKKLYRAIKEAVAKYAPPAIFVYQTCVPALIGDDIDQVCKVASERLGLPVVPVNAPGFVGSKNLGNKLGAEALLAHVIGTIEPGDAGPTDINIIGEYNVAGEFALVKPLFDELGIRIRACITGNSRYRDLAGAHTARVNMMVCSQAMINLGRGMRERWGIPYFEGSFYGIGDTSQTLRTIATLLVERGATADLIARTEALIAREEAKAWAAMAAYRPRLAGKRVLLYTGGVKSWSVVHALQEMGMEVVGTSVRKSTEDDKARARAALDQNTGKVGELFGAIANPEMYRMFRDGEADIMLSGGRSQFVALKARTAWMDINQERHHGYAGYDGMLELVRQMDIEINNPVWAQVRAPAPWDPPAASPGVTPLIPASRRAAP